ncbi:MAG: glycosyltransferase family 4 protein [Deefgea sp.]
MQAAHRIAYLVSRYPAASHVFILREVIGLRARGFEIHTLSINADSRSASSLSEQEQTEQANTINVKNWPRLQLLSDVWAACCLFKYACLTALMQSWRLAKPGWRGHALSLAYYLEALLVSRWLAAKQIKHLHVHFGNEAALVGVLCKTICRCQLSYTIHGPDEFYDVRGQQLAAKVTAADLIICISQFARSQLMLISSANAWAKIHVVRLGIHFDYATPKISNTVTQATLLCVGRLTPAKGQRILLQALQHLADAGHHPQLIFAGGGDDEQALRSMAQEMSLASQVKFLGVLNAESVRSLYQQADVFVLPSFAEGIPVVLMEAMASGLPCISSQITGIPELIEHEKTGLLISAGDALALSQAIQTLLSQPEYAQQLAKAAKEKIAQAYRLENNLDQLAQRFRSFHQELHHA